MMSYMKGGDGLLFKEFMKERRYNYGTLAEAIGVSRITVANWDKGVTSPNLNQVEQLCHLLDIEAIKLFENAWKMKEEKIN